MSVRTWALASMLALLGGFLSCTPKESVAVVHISGEWTEVGSRLRVLPTFAGEPGRTAEVLHGTSEFSVVVPPGKEGDFVLEGMVRVDEGAEENRNVCYVRGGLVPATHFTASPQVQHVELKLITYQQKACEKVCSPDGWCWEHPRPQGNHLRGVWSDRRDNAWAVGDAGTVLRWDGERWVSIPTGITQNLNAVWGPNGSEVWVVGLQRADLLGTALRWNGSSWFAPPFAAKSLYGVWGSSSNDVWAVGRESTIIHWNGDSWIAEPFPKEESEKVTLYDVWGSNPRDAWAVGDEGRVRHWNGISWDSNQVSGAGDLLEVWGSDDRNVWAVGTVLLTGGSTPQRASTTLRWDDATKRWNVETNLDEQRLDAIWGSGSGDVWFAGDRGVIKHWNGSSWEPPRRPGCGALPACPLPLPFGNNRNFTSAWGNRSDDMWLVGEFGVMKHWNGDGWDVFSALNLSDVYSIGGSPSGDVLGVGKDGLTWTCDGKECLSKNISSGDLFDVWVSGPGNALAVGTGGTILKLEGQNWSEFVKPPTTSTLQKVWGISLTDFWTVGEGGAALHFQGSGWRPLETVGMPPINLRGVWSDGSQTVAVGADLRGTDAKRGFLVSAPGL